MIFACQKDSYLKELSTNVISCEPSTLKLSKTENQEGFEVILEDTVLFPEGGGQPDDRGTIGDVPVLRIYRKNGTAVHFTPTPVPVGEDVLLKVDWERRFDHMQQHSGQHLITAIAEAEFNFATTSWCLGENISYIELDTPNIKHEALSRLEEILNEKIRAGIPVRVNLYKPGSEELKCVRTRLELPEGETEQIRVVTIEGIDTNTCCGTHVGNLRDLQAIKLLYVEKGKKNKSNLFFLAGNRILRYLEEVVQREKALTGLLKCGPESHVGMLEKLNKSLKLSQKNTLSLMRDLAVAEAKFFKQLHPRPKFYSYHRKEGDAEFMLIFANEVADNNVLLFLTVGDEKGPGQFLLSGPLDSVNDFGPKVCEILSGKGFAKNGKFQAKVSDLSKKSKAEEMLKMSVIGTAV